MREPQRLVVTVMALVAALLVGHFVLYRGLIVPLLPGVPRAPLWMWALQSAPEVAVVVLGGWGLRSWRWLFPYTAGAAIVRFGFMAALAAAREPGYAKLEPVLASVATPLLLGFAFAYALGFALPYAARAGARSSAV